MVCKSMLLVAPRMVAVRPTTAAAEPSRAQLLTATTIAALKVGDAYQRPTNQLYAVGGSRKRVRVRGEPPPPEQGASPWPTATDTWCWHCCHPFNSQPLPLPVSYDDRRDTFHMTGTFCSWACMKSFNGEAKSYMKSVNANLITLLRKRCTGVLRGIRPAPPRLALKVFGGHLTIDEFRAASDTETEYLVMPPRMVVHELTVHEQDTSAAARSRTIAARAPPDLKAVVDFKEVSTKNETLRLKRPKPLQNNRNLLERTMGIKMGITMGTNNTKGSAGGDL